MSTTNNDFTTTILVGQSPAEVFAAINNPRAWWSADIDGITDKLNEEWTYRFGDNHRSIMKTIELVQNQKVVWLVKENYFKSAKDQSEWVGNRITFDITELDGKTKLVFTQYGLTPEDDCYKACDYGWTGFIGKSLFSLISTGKAMPQWYEQS